MSKRKRLLREKRERQQQAMMAKTLLNSLNPIQEKFRDMIPQSFIDGMDSKKLKIMLDLVLNNCEKKES